jgi:hypothetical protein
MSSCWRSPSLSNFHRPEVVESAFYAWRLTGDSRYQDFVWDAFKSLQKHCKAPASFAAISDVNSLPPKLIDDSESFLWVHFPTQLSNIANSHSWFFWDLSYAELFKVEQFHWLFWRNSTDQSMLVMVVYIPDFFGPEPSIIGWIRLQLSFFD